MEFSIQAVKPWPVASAQFNDVTKTARRDHSAYRTVALQRGVGSHCGAMHQPGYSRKVNFYCEQAAKKPVSLILRR